MKRLTLNFILILIFLCTALYLMFKKPIKLRALEVVPVFHSEEDALKLPTEKAWIYLNESEEVEVETCIDVKHYLIFKALLPNGEKGYINNGEYILLKSGKRTHC